MISGKLSRVRRLLLIALVLSSLAFQGLAVAAQRFLAEHGDRQHAVLHLQEVAHHHHEDAAGVDDASVVVDDSAESISHVASDGALSAPAVPPAISAVLPALLANAPPQWRASFATSPDLQGLRRPPRLSL